MIDIFFTWSFWLIALPLIAIYGNFRKTENGFKKYKYPASSNLNPVRVIDGLAWSTYSLLGSKFKKRSNYDFFIGNFRFSPMILNECKPPYLYRKWAESTEIWFDRLNMRQTTMIWGGMGGGKSIFFIHLLHQNHCYENAIVHDGGKLEMIKKFYNPMRDIILNPYDERATIHDLLSEDPSIQEHFFTLLMQSKSGKEVNFFTTAAVEHLKNITLLVQKQNFKTTKEKWAYFIFKIDELIEETLNDKQRSEGDVVGTLKQIMTPFYLMNFRIQDGAETFVVEDFLKRTHGAKLFVSYQRKMSATLKPISSAFIALYTMIHLSQDDSDKFYFYLIDEFSSYMRMINDDEVLKDQLELLRSKGGMFVGGLQGDDEEENINQIIDKTIRNKFYFRTDGRATKDSLIDRAGKVRYQVENSTKEGSGLKIHKTISYQEGIDERNVITENDFTDLGERFEYIAMIDSNLYRGYTPLPESEKEKNKGVVAEGFIEYSRRREFEDYLATAYEQKQNARFQKNKESSLAQTLTRK